MPVRSQLTSYTTHDYMSKPGELKRPRPCTSVSRRSTSGSGGSIGRKLPVRITLENQEVTKSKEGVLFVDFILTNVGSSTLSLPISPNARKLEPPDSIKSYTWNCLRLYVTTDAAQDSVLVPETSLYGDQAYPETVAAIAPGEFLKVHSKIKLPSTLTAASVGSVLVAHASLITETTVTINGQTVSNAEELGSAASAQYALKGMALQPLPMK